MLLPDDDELDIPALEDEEDDIPPADEPLPVGHAMDPMEEDLGQIARQTMLVPLVDVLPANFKLPTLLKFVPNQALKVAADEAVARALAVTVTGIDGLKQADEAMAEMRAASNNIAESFKDPCALAYDLHKSLTVTRGKWTADVTAAIVTVGDRINRELDRIRREEDAKKRQAALLQQQTPSPTTSPTPPVEAPPIDFGPSATEQAVSALKNTTTTKSWKVRLAGTEEGGNPQPEMSEITMAQLQSVYALLHAILNKQAPVTAIQINYSVLDKRAHSDKSTFLMAGLESYESRGTKGKGKR